MSPRDSLLLSRWIETRDAEAFRELVERYSAMVYSTARRIVRSSDQAEDVTQECFLKLAQKPDARESGLSGWLHRVASNHAITLIRSERRRRRAESARLKARSGSEELNWEEVEPWIDEAIEALPSQQRMPLIEHFLHGRTHDSIAQELGITRKAVGYRIRSGIESIRSFLRKKGLRTTAAALTGGLSALSSSLCPALPQPLVMSLGKIAVGGVRRPVPTKATVSGGALKAGLWIALSISILGGGSYWALRTWYNDKPVGVVVGESARTPVAESSGKPESSDPFSEHLVRRPEGKPLPAETPLSEKTATPAGDERKERAETPLAELVGIVVDSRGRPVRAADVLLAWRPKEQEEDRLGRATVLQEDYWRAERWLAALTSADGQFAFEGVPLQGSASLVACQEGSYCQEKRFSLADADARADLVLKLSTGKTLQGVVVSLGELPLSDGIVSVYHSYNDRGYAGYGGFAPTGPDGRFRLGTHPQATHLTLRVNSDSCGQRFFPKVPVSNDRVRLQFQRDATIRGSIVWSDGKPATGMVVCATAEVPEPRPLQAYSGDRHRTLLQSEVDDYGNYVIENLHPGFLWYAFVTDPADEAQESRLHPLSPQWDHGFELKAGETKVWDYSLARRIRVQGRVVTARIKTPVPRIQIGVRKDGHYKHTVFCETGKDGNFELVLNTGAGSYLLVATPERTWEDLTKLVAESFGKIFVFKGGENVEVDLETFEPTELPIRVLNADKEPMESIEASLSFRLPNGKGHGVGSSYALDGEGRYTFKIYHPVTELSLEVSKFPRGPRTKVGPFTPTLGTSLPETTIVLHPTCNLSGVLLKPSGEPRVKTRVKIQAAFEDGTRQQMYAMTDKKGYFLVKDDLRAAPLTLKIFAGRQEREWGSGLLIPGADQELSIGEIVVED